MGPLLFYIYLCDLFIFANDINIDIYDDDITSNVSGETLNSKKKSLKKAADLSLTWFNYNQMKGNGGKRDALRGFVPLA